MIVSCPCCGSNTIKASVGNGALILYKGTAADILTSTVLDSVTLSPCEGVTNKDGDTAVARHFSVSPDDKLQLNSGRFTTSVKASVTLPSGYDAYGISFDSENSSYPWCGRAEGGTQKLLDQSGEFTTTIKASIATTYTVQGISWDGTDSLWTDQSGAKRKLWRWSGKFTSTEKDSEAFPGGPSPQGIANFAGDTLCCNNAKSFYVSGNFTSTVKESEQQGTFHDDITTTGEVGA